MTYDQFVSTFSYGFNLILNGLYSVCTSLMNNYIFLTFLGMSLFISFFWFIYYTFFHIFDKEVDDILDYNDRYDRYKQFREIRKEFNTNNQEFNEEEAIQSLQTKRDAIMHLNGGSLNYVVPQPVWLYQDVPGKPPTQQEKQEMDDIINNF